MKRTFSLLFFFFFCLSGIAIYDLHAQVLTEGESSALKEDKAPSNYSYDLKALIVKSKENMRSVSDKIKEQAVQKRNQQREQKAREYYDQAQKLNEEGRLDEAREYYEKAIKITEHPEMEHYIKESEKRRKRAEAALAHEETEMERRRAKEAKMSLGKAQNAYEQAVSFYKQQHFKEAREQFLLVQALSPDYKAVKCYLQIVAQELRRPQQQAGDTDHQEKAGERPSSKQAGNVEWVVPDFKSGRSYLKPVESDLEKSKGSHTEEQKKEQKNLRFDATVADNKMMGKADEKSKISAAEMIKRKEEKDIAENKMQAADELFTQAMDLYKKGLLIDAKTKFIAVDQNVPDYKSARTYLIRIDDDIAAMVAGKRKGHALATQKQELDRLREIRDKAESAYNEAIVAYDNKEYEKAKAGFQQAENIYPNYKKATYYLGRIDEDIKRQEEQNRRASLEKNAESIYVQAIALYGSDQFEDAKKKFVEVAALLSDYKQTTFYLERIDDDIIKKKEKTLNDVRQRQAEVLYNQATSLYQSTEYEQAKDKFLELEGVFSSYKETPRYLATIDQDIFRKKEESRQREKADQAEDIYKQALALYKVGDFESAKDKFVRIAVVYPDYKDISRYLADIDGDIDRKRKEAELRARAEQVEPIYNQAIDLYKAQELSEAKKKFLQVQSIYSNYKETLQYLSLVDGDMRILEERLAREEKQQKEDRLYTEALRSYGNRDFEDAKKKFLDVSSLDPQYKNLKNYLSRIDADIRDESLRLKRIAQEEQALPIYTEALDLYHNKKDFVMAKSLFIEVERILPDYKKTESYLARIDKDIKDQNAELDRKHLVRAEALYQQAITFLTQKKEIDAYQRLMELEAYYPDYKATRNHIEKLKQSFALKGIVLSPVGMPEKPEGVEKKQVEKDTVLAVYEEAVLLFKNKKSHAARIKFQEIEKIHPGYRSTRKYLADIKQTENLKKKERIDALMKEQLARQSQRHKVENKPQGLAVQDKQRQEVLWKEKEAQKKKKNEEREFQAKADVFYQQGQELFAVKNYSAAKKCFDETIDIIPNYKDVGQYFVRIARVEAEEKQRQDFVLKEKQRQETKRQEQEAQEKKRYEERELRRKADPFYQQGVELFRAKKFSAARESFGEALKVFPGYTDAVQYVGRIDRVEAEETQRQKEVAVRQAAREQAEKERQDQALKEKQRQEAKRQEQEAQEKKRYEERELQRKANSFYQQGVELFRAKKFSAARESFGEALKVFPGYTDAVQYVGRIDRVEAEETQRQKEAAVRQAAREQAEKQRQDLALKEKQRQEAKRQEQEAQEKKRYEERELQRKVNSFYQQGVESFRAKKFSAARESFGEVLKLIPGYKDVGQYIVRIDVTESAGSVEKISKPREYELKTTKAEPVYGQAIELYKAQRYDEAKVKFDEVTKILPKYKSTDDYLALIAKIQAQKSPEELRKEAAAVQELSTRSADLYRQIKDLSNDKEMASVTRTFSKIDKVIANLESEQNRIAQEILRQEKAAREAAAKIARDEKAARIVQAQEAAKNKKVAGAQSVVTPEGVKAPVAPIPKTAEQQKADAERQRLVEAEKLRQEAKRQEREAQDKKRNEEMELHRKADALYQQATDLFRSKKYSLARERFNDLLKLIPGYKDGEKYLVRIDRSEGEEKLLEEENKDKQEIARLADKANTVNVDALQCSQDKNFIGLQTKFSDLAELLKEIKVVKDRMQIRRDKFAASWESRADDSKKKLVLKEKIRRMKLAAEKQEIREKSRKLFREGEMFYANGEYPEARAKFVEAALVDPNLRAAKTYTERIDRISSGRDYEEQRNAIKKENRDLERRQEKKEGLIADQVAGSAVTDFTRANTVYDEGIAFYKIKRYREARIKFEEASKEGDGDQRKKAERYLKLVETALEDERLQAEKAKADGEKRYVETKRTEDLLSSQPDDKKQHVGGVSKSFDEEADDAAVQRQLEIRMIEQQNALERSKMFEEGAQASKKADQEDKAEGRKYTTISRQENMKPLQKEEVQKEVVKVSKEEVKVSTPPQVVLKKEAPVVTDVKTETVSRNVLKKNRDLSTTDVREVRRFQRLAAEENARQEREERQLAALAREKKIMLRDQVHISKEVVEQDEVPVPEKVIKKEQAPVSKKVVQKAQAPSLSLVVLRDDRKAAQEEKSRLLKVAADQEKRLLNQQRAAIQKDFEAGVSRLYNDAVLLFNKQLYEEAREVFLEVQGLISGYKKTDDYLKQISRKISGQKGSSGMSPSPASSSETISAGDRSQAMTQILDRVESTAQ